MQACANPQSAFLCRKPRLRWFSTRGQLPSTLLLSNQMQARGTSQAHNTIPHAMVSRSSKDRSKWVQTGPRSTSHMRYISSSVQEDAIWKEHCHACRPQSVHGIIDTGCIAVDLGIDNPSSSHSFLLSMRFSPAFHAGFLAGLQSARMAHFRSAPQPR